MRKYKIKIGELTSKEAQKYLSGYFGYITIANTRNLENKIFYNLSNEWFSYDIRWKNGNKFKGL